jgi:CBS domain-containing protein
MKVSESMKISDKMTRDLVTINPMATARDVAKKMLSENVGTVLVLDQGMLKGLVTDRQITTKVVAAGEDPAVFKVSEFMTTNPLTCRPDMGMCEVARMMGEHGYRRMPVVEGNKLIGIISVADIAEHAKGCNLCTEGILKAISKAQR